MEILETNQLMPYSIVVSAYKESGKYYSGETHEIGEFDCYPANEIYEKLEFLRNNLDIACGLRDGSVIQNNFTVVYIVLDSLTKSPICLSGIFRNKV